MLFALRCLGLYGLGPLCLLGLRTHLGAVHFELCPAKVVLLRLLGGVTTGRGHLATLIGPAIASPIPAPAASATARLVTATLLPDLPGLRGRLPLGLLELGLGLGLRWGCLLPTLGRALLLAARPALAAVTLAVARRTLLLPFTAMLTATLLVAAMLVPVSITPAVSPAFSLAVTTSVATLAAMAMLRTTVAAALAVLAVRRARCLRRNRRGG